jgi:tRNA threonylcarbamoyladenosine biosynthesis protein TsaB
MNLLLIDTAVTTASVCIARNGAVIAEKTNAAQKDHAAWIHKAILDVVEDAGISLNDLDAVGVSAGPGSYTGLRVGMSTAKGICYAMNKPLILVNTLKMMAAAAAAKQSNKTVLLCPMIDARRMEVFTAVFDQELNVVIPQSNMILEKESFKEILEKNKIHFFGNGSEKFGELVKNENIILESVHFSATNMVSIVTEKFEKSEFSDVAYAEPLYGKDFHLPSVNSNIYKP